MTRILELIYWLTVSLFSTIICLIFQDESVKQTAQLIYQTALMESGFNLNDPKDFASHIYSSVKSSLNISPDATVEEDDDVEENEGESDTKEAAATPKAEEADDVKDEL